VYLDIKEQELCTKWSI